MLILEENFKWHLEAFASELFIYFHTYMVKLVMYAAVGMWNWKTPWVAAECLLSMLHDTAVKA